MMLLRNVKHDDTSHTRVGKFGAGSPPCCLNFFCAACYVSQRGVVNLHVQRNSQSLETLRFALFTYVWPVICGKELAGST